MSFNSGYSTYLNPSGRRLLQREGIHATAHGVWRGGEGPWVGVVLTAPSLAYPEIGHGWGSDHDPIDDPTGNGPYLMHPFALSGVEASHQMFSDESRRQIGRVLEVRGSCFQGNHRLHSCMHHWCTLAVPVVTSHNAGVLWRRPGEGRRAM